MFSNDAVVVSPEAKDSLHKQALGFGYNALKSGWVVRILLAVTHTFMPNV